MRLQLLSIPGGILAVCATTAAQSHRADFDTVPEGILGTVYLEDGIRFSNLDRYLGNSNEIFVAEDASASLAGKPGFTPPNTLGFGGWSPGPTAAYSRCGKFDITPPPAIYDHAELWLYIAGSGSVGNTVTLEARLGGGLVVTDTYVVGGPGTYHVQLVIDGEDFDSLKFVSTGPANQGAVFALVDAVVVGTATPAGTPYCDGDGSGTPCPCGNNAGANDGCMNSTGNGAELVPGGSPSLAADDLRFQVVDLPATQPVLLFAGLNAVNGGQGLPLADGLRCAGGAIQRIGVHTSSVQGEALWDPGVLGGHGWSSGTTVHFQAWYRDPNGPCGSGSNLTNGVAVSVQP